MNTTAHKHSKFQLLALRVLSNSRWLGNFPQEALQRLVDNARLVEIDNVNQECIEMVGQLH